MFFVKYKEGKNGVFGTDILRAMPPDGPASVLTSIPSTRIPVNVRMLVPTLSNDNTMLAVPLIDGQTSNIWALPTSGAPLRQLTDFGHRSVTIARRVAWSPDDKFIYAAVADVQTDLVSMSLSGLVRPNADAR
jgi:hypothetical protein